MDFEIVGPISEIEVIAAGRRFRDIDWLTRLYGPGRWRKLKGIALVRLPDTGEVFNAEIHWYEAPHIGQVDFKIKRRIV
jgi:hypothetical protein